MAYDDADEDMHDDSDDEYIVHGHTHPQDHSDTPEDVGGPPGSVPPWILVGHDGKPDRLSHTNR